MKITISKKHIEPIINLALWLVILLVALFVDQNEGDFKWKAALYSVIWLIPFFFIYFINNNLLAPYLLFKKKYFAYFTISFILITAVSLSQITKTLHQSIAPDSMQFKAQRFQNRTLPPPEVQREGSLPPHLKPPKNARRAINNNGRVDNTLKGKTSKFLANFLIGFLVIGFNTAIKQSGKLIIEEQLRHNLQEQKLQTELAFLKHQISPHFLMNTLNNIHSLIDIDTKVAQSSIIRLSHMLRYLLYEKEDKITTLSREIEFIESYIDLMRLRYSEKLKIDVSIDKELPQLSVPPFVFITIIENAFKHGVVPNKPGYINISIKHENSTLIFTCNNSKTEKRVTLMSEGHGIGLVNTRKRLNMYYGDKYSWEIFDNKDNYISTIKLPTYEA
ncbi:hypothetical protein E9993_05980 [Labilibacter sediminis]|nr:hypothetical protein E9993_05980 [Labilibacter sediminis]